MHFDQGFIECTVILATRRPSTAAVLVCVRTHFATLHPLRLRHSSTPDDHAFSPRGSVLSGRDPLSTSNNKPISYHILVPLLTRLHSGRAQFAGSLVLLSEEAVARGCVGRPYAPARSHRDGMDGLGADARPLRDVCPDRVAGLRSCWCFGVQPGEDPKVLSGVRGWDGGGPLPLVMWGPLLLLMTMAGSSS